MRPHSLSLVIGLACAGPAAAQVRPGIEVLLSDSIALVTGKRVALLTNQTGVDRLGRRDIDLLRGAPGVRLTLILSPEHGLEGAVDRPGLPDAVDPASGLPIYSLYGGTPLPNIAALDSVDLVLVDLQDVGARYYTYPVTAVLLMAEAARRWWCSTGRTRSGVKRCRGTSRVRPMRSSASATPCRCPCVTG